MLVTFKHLEQSKLIEKKKCRVSPLCFLFSVPRLLHLLSTRTLSYNITADVGSTCRILARYKFHDYQHRFNCAFQGHWGKFDLICASMHTSSPFLQSPLYIFSSLEQLEIIKCTSFSYSCFRAHAWCTQGQLLCVGTAYT